MQNMSFIPWAARTGQQNRGPLFFLLLFLYESADFDGMEDALMENLAVQHFVAG